MTSSAPRRRHLASSPFKPPPELVIPDFEMGDLVTHDVYGMGRIVGIEPAAVTVDFSPKVVRVGSPYAKMSKL